MLGYPAATSPRGRFPRSLPVRFIPESVFDLSRNQCSIYPGISVRFAPEYATKTKGWVFR